MTDIQDDVEAKARKRRLCAFTRRARAAESGIHLPTLFELYCNMAFSGQRLSQDAQSFAERLLPRLKANDPGHDLAKAGLQALTLAPSVDIFLQVAAALEPLESVDRGKDIVLWREAKHRCIYYAAALGDAHSMVEVARTLLGLSLGASTPGEAFVDLMSHGIGWLSLASEGLPVSFYRHVNVREEVVARGKLLSKRFTRELEVLAQSNVNDQQPSSPIRSQPSSDKNEKAAENTSLQTTATIATRSIVVVPNIGNPDIADGKRVSREFREIHAKPLPLIPLPDLGAISKALNDEFPHAVAVTSVFLSDLASRPHIAWRPTVLVGAPGCGKSSYAERLLDLFDVPNETYNCGGVSDSAISGTARRYASGEPSLPLSIVRRYACASPGIILDEVEKASSSRHNGSVLDVLLALFERNSARTWFDPYVEAAVDLSHVIWLATANGSGELPGPLADRCRIIRFPNPEVSHLHTLANRMLKGQTELRGLRAGWAQPLTGEELDAIGDYWKGGSLRILERLVEAVLTARDRSMQPQ